MINRQNDPRKGMKVPDGFFDQFEEDIMVKINQQKVIRFWTIKRITSIAAAFMVLVASVFILKFYTTSDESQFALDSSDVDWEYLLDYPSEFTYEDIAELEESEFAIADLEIELFGSYYSDEMLEDLELETINELYK